MDDQVLAQLNRLIDEHHESLCQRLDDLAAQVEVMHALVVARLEAHELYHHQFEHRWGLIRLAERYPFRLALLAFAGAWVLLAGTPGSLRWLGEAARRLLVLAFGHSFG
jgi:hypothetical protein